MHFLQFDPSVLLPFSCWDIFSLLTNPQSGVSGAHVVPCREEMVPVIRPYVIGGFQAQALDINSIARRVQLSSQQAYRRSHPPSHAQPNFPGLRVHRWPVPDTYFFADAIPLITGQ